MKFTFNYKDCSKSPAFEEIVAEKLKRIEKHFHAENLQVNTLLEGVKNLKKLQIDLIAKEGNFMGQSKGDDAYKLIDEVFQKIERQVIKIHEKRDAKRKRVNTFPEFEAGEQEVKQPKSVVKKDEITLLKEELAKRDALISSLNETIKSLKSKK